MIANENRSELLQSLKEGSFSAFEKLYNLYSGKLYNFIMRLSSGNQYMAEEVVQQTFIRLWEVREKVDPTENFVSYLCTIARNLSMNMYQHQTVEYIYTEYLLGSSDRRKHRPALPERLYRFAGRRTAPFAQENLSAQQTSGLYQ